MSPSLPSGPWQVRTHPAMNTLFTLRLGLSDGEKASAVAGECFRQLEELESLLSRYREDSDISAINNLSAGSSLLLHEETWNCLKLALEVHGRTGGLFDITLGALTDPERSGNSVELRGCLQLNPERPEIICVEAGRQLDLGGIGKGRALDRMAGTLHELGVGEALLSAGASTHLAMGRTVWPVELKATAGTRIVMLPGGSSLSASGTGIQGDHIVHPLRDAAQFPKRTWAVASMAAFSDAFSTACFLARDEERRTFLQEIPALSGVFVEDGEGRIAVIEGSRINLADRG